MTPLAKKLSTMPTSRTSPPITPSLTCGKRRARGRPWATSQAGKTLAKNCAGCHGETGIPAIRPGRLLAGQKPGLSGERAQGVPRRAAQGPDDGGASAGNLSDADIANLAAFYAAQKLRSRQSRGRDTTMKTESDLASAARRRFLGKLGLAATCTGAVAGAGALGLCGVASAKTELPQRQRLRRPPSPRPRRKRARSRPRTTTGRSTNGRSASTPTSASAACAASRPARPRTTCRAMRTSSAPGSSATSTSRARRRCASTASRTRSTSRPPGSEKEYRFANRYKGAKVDKAFFVPKLCNQCSHPACVQVCPVGATYRTEDGVVLIDHEALHRLPLLRAGLPLRRALLRRGKEAFRTSAPGAITASPRDCSPPASRRARSGARVFGDMRDRQSPISLFIRNNRVQVLKPESGNAPERLLRRHRQGGELMEPLIHVRPLHRVGVSE